MEKKGVWGNNSARVERTIPTLVKNDDRAGKVASGKLPTFKYKATDYGAYMLNQLYELLTEIRRHLRGLVRRCPRQHRRH